jgi:uncharacterized BrkB/YihY/UPF0761 family membrane protein
MADVSQHGSLTSPRTIGSGYLFGVPLGDLGFFTSLVMSVAIGFTAFFAATFCAIVSLLFYNTATHSAVDFALTYRRVGLPVGLLVLVLALSYLGTLWVRRHLRKA